LDDFSVNASAVSVTAHLAACVTLTLETGNGSDPKAAVIF